MDAQSGCKGASRSDRDTDQCCAEGDWSGHRVSTKAGAIQSYEAGLALNE
jgi:hypothetical protein